MRMQLSRHLWMLLAGVVVTGGCSDEQLPAPSADADITVGETQAPDSQPPPDAASLDAAVADAISDGVAADTDDASDAADTSDDAAQDTTAPEWPVVAPTHHGAFLWRGMAHTWLRTVAGFRVPHRISQLDSYVDGASFTDTGAGAASFVVGQSTGVDGNYMKPVGEFSAVFDTDLYVQHGSITLNWTDDSDDGEYPKAISNRTDEVTIPLNVPELGNGLGDHYGIVLLGFQLTTTCDDAKQPPDEPCNSNGMWPYRFFIGFSTCQRTEDTLVCPLDVAIHRAWTPNLGGLPPFEVKPFSDKLDFELTVHYSVLGGASSNVRVVVGELQSTPALGHDDQPKVRLAAIDAAPGFAGSTVGLAAIGFELGPPPNQTTGKFQHLGRYIAGLQTQLEDHTYDEVTGQFVYQTHSRVWLPDTVANATVTHLHRAVAIQLRDGAAIRDNAGQVVGSLCRNSSPQAPELTAWDKCGSGDKGPEQTRDQIAITTP